MEIGAAAAAAAGEVTKNAIGHLEREIRYHVDFRKNVNNLKSKFLQLIAEKSVVDELISRSSNNNEVIRETVNTWLRDVDVVQIDVTQLIDEAGQISNSFKGQFGSRFRLGRKAYKKILGIQDLLERRNLFGDTVSNPKPTQNLELVYTDDYEDFYSRKPLTNEMMEVLLDKSICLVGVFGMPGIGKTKFLEALSRRVKEEKLFDKVVIVTVTQNPDVKAIQDDIAKELGMQLEENERITWRATFLHDRLKTQDKMILILLDDLWNELNLQEVGIPKQSGCKSYKIIIATRNEAVCRIMETDRELYVPVLSEHESWTLFRKKVGDVVDSADINTIAREVVDECAGLPLAIVLLGRTLRKKTNANVWADALRRLKKSINENLGRVYSSIRLSYDFLPFEVHKRCFLFCSLFPEDYNIDVKDKLLVYVVGENLLEDGVDCLNNLEETKWRLDNIVEDLISSSLLLRGYRVGYTKMHDVVRDVAKRIASDDKEYKQQADAVQTDLMRWPKQLESCKRLSLMRTKIKCNLPCQVEAPQLLTLILTASEGFSELPCDFFEEMKNLRNLNLSDTEIASLPPSISCLVELRTLRLTRCSSLQNISPVGKLHKLEILDLGQSGIERLSEEMGMLTNLKSLNISYMEDLKSISPKVISSMYQLEELYAHSFQGWEIGEMGGNINANLSEVASLANLTCLRICMPSMECFSTSIPIQWVKLKEFTVYVTDCTHPLIVGFQRHLYLEIPSSISVPNEVLWLLSKADFVRLYNCNDLESVVQVDPTGGLKENNLKWLDVRECYEMKYLISSIEVEKDPEISFSSLQHLHFWDLENLESICNGKTLPHGFLHSLRDLFFTSCRRLTCLINLELQNLGNTSASSCSMLLFSNLRNLRLKGCDKIRYVLPMSIARHLNQLVEFSVKYCPSIEMIFVDDNGEDDGDKYILPRLKCLELRKLPALLSFGRPAFIFDWDCLTHLYLSNCGNLKSLPCRVTQQRLSKINYFGLDETLINLLEDPSIIDKLEHHVLVDNSFYCKKRD